MRRVLIYGALHSLRGNQLETRAGYWGFGFATEAARAARDYGFSQMGLEQIVSFTVPANQRSRNVMGRIGMTHSPMMTLNIPFCQTVILFATTSFTGSLGALGG